MGPKCASPPLITLSYAFLPLSSCKSCHVPWMAPGDLMAAKHTCVSLLNSDRLLSGAPVLRSWQRTW